MMNNIIDSNFFNLVLDRYIDNDVFSKVTIPQLTVTLKEEYCHEVLMLLFKLNSAFEDIELNRKFISQYQNNTLFLMLDIENDAYLRYNLEYFYLQIPRVFDLSLKLINVIYKLNLNGMGINYERIIKRVEVDESVKLLVSQFYLQIIKIKEIRNEITHSNEFNEKNIDILRITKHLSQNSKNQSIEKIISENSVLINDHAYKNILEFTAKTNLLSFEYIVKLFSCLQSSFSYNIA